MVIKKKTKTSDMQETNGRVKVGKLRINKETVKDLTSDETQNVKGGTGLCAGSQVGGVTVSCVASPEQSPRPVGPQYQPTVIRLLCGS